MVYNYCNNKKFKYFIIGKLNSYIYQISIEKLFFNKTNEYS